MERLPHYRYDDRYITRHEYGTRCVDLHWRNGGLVPYFAEITSPYEDENEDGEFCLHMQLGYELNRKQRLVLTEYDGWYSAPEALITALAEHGIEVEEDING